MARTKEDTSYRALLAALAPGDTWSKVLRIDGDRVPKDQLSQTAERLTGAAAAAIHRAKADNPEADYISERFDVRTRSYDILIGVAVTRLR